MSQVGVAWEEITNVASQHIPGWQHRRALGALHAVVRPQGRYVDAGASFHSYGLTAALRGMKGWKA